MSKIINLFLIYLLILSTTMFATITEVQEEQFDVQYGGKLSVKADRGSITIKTHNSETIEVKIKYKFKTSDEDLAQELLDKFEVTYDDNGKDLEIIAKFDKNFLDWFSNRDRNKLQVQFYLTVPEEYNVDIGTSGGSINVDDLNGFVDAQTSGGSLNFGNISGDIYGHTSGGSITIADCDGNTEIKTSGGSINIDKVKGYVNAHTSGGGITVNEVYGNISATTSGGSIYAAIMEQPEHDCKLKTSGGSITVKLSSKFNLDLDASTSGGSVNVDFQIKYKGKIKSNKLRGELNDGGPELILRTSGGSINIEEI